MSLVNSRLGSKVERILAGVLLLLFPFFFISGPGHGASRSLISFWNLGHPFFFGAALLVLGRFHGHGREWRLLLLVAAGLFGLGGAIELIQSLQAARTASLYDWLADLAGIVAAVALLRWRFSSVCQRNGLLFIAFLALSWNLLPLGWALLDEQRARQEFPLLSGFESTLEFDRWHGKARMFRVNYSVTQGHHAARVHFTTDKYSGISLNYFPHDWRGWGSLALDLYNPQTTELQITVRIHDAQHEMGKQLYGDRYNQRFLLAPGWNQISISLQEVKSRPKDRAMDMSQIRSPGFFVSHEKEEKTLVLDNVRLLP